MNYHHHHHQLSSFSSFASSPYFPHHIHHHRRNLNNYSNNNNNKHEIKELQKTATLSAAHRLGEVLIEKYKTNFTGEITLHVAQIVKTEELQYILETWFVSGI